MNLEEQKTIAYRELYNLLNLVPLKYGRTRKDIKGVMDSLNNEEWLLRTG